MSGNTFLLHDQDDEALSICTALQQPGVPDFVTIDGVRLRTLSWNMTQHDKPVLLLIHGFRAHAHWWDAIAPFFSEKFRIVAMEFSGMGDSDHRDSYDADTYASEIIGVIEALGIGPLTAIGHSYGGARLLSACADRPDLFRRAILVDSYIPFADDAGPRMPKPMVAQRINATFDEGCARYRLMPEQPATVPVLLRHVAENALRKVDGGWSLKFDPQMPVSGARDRDGAALLGRVTTPVDLIYGQYSKVVSPQLAARVASHLTSVRGPFMLADGHHHLMLDQPRALAGLLHQLLSGPGPVRLQAPTLWSLVLQRARLSPEATMLIEAGGTLCSFGQFARDAERLAAGLHAMGIGAGTMVTWQLPTRISSVLLSVALARLGAIQGPIIHLYGRKEVTAILARNRPGFHIASAAEAGERDAIELAESVCATLASPPRIITLDDGIAIDDIDALPAAPGADGIARWIYTTSGTTAEPKGALHTDATLMAAGHVYGEALGVGPEDVGTIVFPYAHVGGPMNLVMLLSTGMSALLMPKFVVDDAVAAFRRHGVTVSSGSTAHYLAFLAEQRKQPGQKLIPSLRILSGGGAPKPPELYFDVLGEMHCTIAHSYGMTEVPMISGASPRHSDDQLARSDGAPVSGMEVRILRADGAFADVGESGEIRVKGPTVCKGYTNPALTAEAFDSDGFFRTGDIGLRRADGHIALTGRLKDIIIRKGENISAREIEDILYQHPKVGAAAVIGLPDRERGERVCAVIELRDPAVPLSLAEMIAFFEQADTMRQKIPEQLEIVDRLPRNETFNKILKFKLREQFA